MKAVRPTLMRKAMIAVVLTGGVGGIATSLIAQGPAAPEKLNWYGDPGAPNVSGVWIRDDAASRGRSGSTEGWAPWAPPLRPQFAAIWKKRVADAAAGSRTDDPIQGCMPAGMPRFDTGMTGPMMIAQTPGRVTLYRDGMPVRRIWVNGRPLPDAKDLESFSNGNAIGHYEGGDLVTEIAGIRNQPIDSTGVPHSDDLRIVERFHRTDEKTLRIQVTLTDKTAFTRPMTSTVIYKLFDNPLWEPKEFLCSPGKDYHPDIIVH